MSMTHQERINNLLGVISSFECRDEFSRLYASRTGFTEPDQESAAGPEQKYTVTIETTSERFLEEFAAFLLTRRRP